MSTTIANTAQLATAQKERIHRVFEAQRANQFNVANTTARERIKKLDKLHKAVMKYRPEIKEALFNDFGKHPAEVDLAEIYCITGEIKHTRRHLKSWMKRRVGTPIAFMGSSSHIHYEPKGVCLIISPWNFPVQLTFGPLISAIAAGNTVMIKPSEHTPHASAIMKKIVEELFDENEIAVFEGAVETSSNLLELPFNHIFFTGSPMVGKIVMGAAAKHLTSVTLELGGKSPTVIDETADLKAAARRTAWGKYLNNGQICIAPDYIYIHESKKDKFVEVMKQTIKDFYGDDVKASKDYCRMVNARHTARVKSYLDDAVDKGAKIECGGVIDVEAQYIEPTVVTNVPSDSKLMTDEIFGPILPIKTFKTLEEVVGVINSKEKPLAMYIFSRKNKNIKYLMNNTRAGGTCINNNDVHFFNNNMPFGGSNNSGIGKSHGRWGFEAFSNARGVYRQHIPGALEMLMPPYNGFKEKMIDLTIKWF